MPTVNRRRGYVLLVVIVILTMSTTLLVTVGQLAVGNARSAAMAETALQRKWAQISARQALLPHAETLLTQAEVASQAPVARIDRMIQLGDLSVAIALCDEQAKANVNQLLEQSPASAVADRLRMAWSGSGWINEVHLRPLVTAPTDAPRLGPPAVIRSFGQIFNTATGDHWFDPHSVSGQITCWGSGAINVLRADEPALVLALSPSLTHLEISRLVEEREKRWRSRPSAANASPSATGDAVQSLLDSAKVSPRNRAQLALTDHSTCHSVWIVVKDRQRVWYNWFVLDESMPAQPRLTDFRW